MAVVNAVRNKLILRVFACVNQNRLLEKNYVRPGSNFNNAVFLLIAFFSSSSFRSLGSFLVL